MAAPHSEHAVLVCTSNPCTASQPRVRRRASAVGSTFNGGPAIRLSVSVSSAVMALNRGRWWPLRCAATGLADPPTVMPQCLQMRQQYFWFSSRPRRSRVSSKRGSASGDDDDSSCDRSPMCATLVSVSAGTGSELSSPGATSTSPRRRLTWWPRSVDAAAAATPTAVAVATTAATVARTAPAPDAAPASASMLTDEVADATAAPTMPTAVPEAAATRVRASTGAWADTSGAKTRDEISRTPTARTAGRAARWWRRLALLEEG